MKRIALRLAFAAAAVVVTAAIGSAQMLKAEVPFPFYAAGAQMQPGTYTVQLTNNGRTVVQIYNLDNKRGVLALPLVEDRPLRATASAPALTFECVQGACQLARLTNGNATIYSFSRSKAAGTAHIATVLLKSDRAD